VIAVLVLAAAVVQPLGLAFPVEMVVGATLLLALELLR
jgi:hypothetical protein